MLNLSAHDANVSNERQPLREVSNLTLAAIIEQTIKRLWLFAQLSIIFTHSWFIV
jgi:hypothetical protein